MKKTQMTVVLIAMILSSQIYAASDSNTKTNKQQILNITTKLCANVCKPKLLKIIDNYASVLLVCKKQNCENDVAYLKKSGATWIVVEQGTGIDPDDLVKDGFPKAVANQLSGNGEPVK